MTDVMNPNRLTAFESVHVLTYLFNGQLFRAYLDYFGIGYDIVGIEKDANGLKFSDRPDEPEPVDYNRLIDIIGRSPQDARGWAMNEIGKNRTSLSATWYKARYKNHEDIVLLKNKLRTVARRGDNTSANGMIWTTFKGSMEWLLGPKHRYASSFLPLNARATNKYRSATTVAYLANRFVDPNFLHFFEQRGTTISSDDFALSELLQFVWRSAIRDGKKITLYIPSKRMRTLLIDWMTKMNEGACE